MPKFHRIKWHFCLRNFHLKFVGCRNFCTKSSWQNACVLSNVFCLKNTSIFASGVVVLPKKGGGSARRVKPWIRAHKRKPLPKCSLRVGRNYAQLHIGLISNTEVHAARREERTCRHLVWQSCIEFYLRKTSPAFITPSFYTPQVAALSPEDLADTINDPRGTQVFFQNRLHDIIIFSHGLIVGSNWEF